MAWIRGVVAYGLSEHAPGVVAVSRGAGNFVGPLTLTSSPYASSLPRETPFRRPFDALGWQIVRFCK